jgi:ABC-2 type transport system ATP-binding protein
LAILELTDVTKRFGSQVAVDRVSFDVQPGEIFGLIGPNGAGKTTTLRMILDIFRPDEGSIAVFGGALNDRKKALIGYLPEERGLYQDIPLDDCIVYLASLKGLSNDEAKRRMEDYLKRFDLVDHRHKKVKEMSKGMQQKAQLIVTLIHDPQLIIVDEPFTSLDPVNTEMIKDLLRERREAGAAIILCTHQMDQVEALCDRLAMINRGQIVLYGTLDEIQHSYAPHAVLVRTSAQLPAAIPGVASVERVNTHLRMNLAEGTAPQDLLRTLVSMDIPLEQFQLALPSLEEIFVNIVRGETP